MYSIRLIMLLLFCLLAFSCSDNEGQNVPPEQDPPGQENPPGQDPPGNGTGEEIVPDTPCIPKVGSNLTQCAIEENRGDTASYTYPIGVPEINWGSLNPILDASPARPAAWPDQVAEGFYYIDPSHANATDLNNTYGTPNNPRLSFPPNPIVAGSYIELGGSGFSGRYRLRFSCTEQAPCWLRGQSRDAMPTITGTITVENATYLLMENLDFNGGDNGALGIIGMQSHHVALRDSYIQNRRYLSHTSGIGITPNLGGSVHDIVIYNNVFRELGTWQNLLDEDFHGIAPNVAGRDATTENRDIWILSNDFYHISGNGVQVVAGNWPNSFQYLHHIYIGKNLAYENRQAGFWSKQSSHVIMSQNTSHGHRMYGGGMGDGIGFQYGPDNLWIIFNTLYDSNFGIRQSDTSPGFENNKAYIVGNLIHNIHPEAGMAYNPETFWRPGVAVSLWGGVMQRFIVDNTIYNTRGGISLVFDGPATMSGNIIANIDDGDYFLSAFLGTRTGVVHMDHLLIYNTSGIQRFRWDANRYTDIQSFAAATGQCGTHCISADPLFKDPLITQPDLSLSTGSEAIDPDANRAVDVYQVFEDLYGLDIRKDITGRTRPVGTSNDYGAYEFSQ